MASAHLVTLILVTDTVGKGAEGDPVQRRQTLITPSGRLIAMCSAMGDLDHVYNGDGWTELDEQAGGSK